MKFTLVIRFGDKLINTLEFEKDMVSIGRDPKCDVFIDNLAVSRLHAIIERKDIFYILRDMGSDNGIYIRGQMVKKYNLNNEDEFFIGKYSIIFKQTEEEDEEVLSPSEILPTPQELEIFSNRAEDIQVIDTSLTMAVDSRHMINIQKKQEILAAYFIVEEGAGVKRKVPVVKSILYFGTHSQADFIITGWGVTKRHVIIFQDGKSFNIVHMGNRKPPKVNDKIIDNQKLKEGDVIEIGRYKLTFHIGA